MKEGCKRWKSRAEEIKGGVEEDAGRRMREEWKEKQDREHGVSEGCGQKKTREKERKGG